VTLGILNPPAQAASSLTAQQAFMAGLNVGYNTLDLIASFIFAPLVMAYFISDQDAHSPLKDKRQVFKKMIKAALIAGGLLASMYIALTFIASHYTPILPIHAPEERLAVISRHLLGSVGALFSCIAISFACLTTAIPISAFSAEYIHRDFMRGKGSIKIAIAISLLLSMLVANLGFMGIANMLSPILQILCPGLIILSILNIFHKLYEMKMRRTPVYAAFALSFLSYLARL
jgi:LIVCS family branched-chain amino acid:cation transporter